jgi:site-specific DNA recombinase
MQGHGENEKPGFFKVYRGVATGRKMAQRKRSQELLQDTDKLKFQAVTVWSISRFGRNIADISHNVNFLKDKGIILYAVKEPIDSSSSFGKMVIDVLGASAELESSQIAERTSSAKRA